MNCQVGLSCMEFFDKFVSDNAVHAIDKFFESKQAKNIVTTPWREPSETEKIFNG